MRVPRVAISLKDPEFKKVALTTANQFAKKFYVCRTTT